MTIDPKLLETLLTSVHAQQIMLSSAPSKTTGSSPIDSMSAFPVIRRMSSSPSTFPFMTDLIKIQPMTAPVGSIFFMDYVYGGERYDLEPGWITLRPGAIVLGTKGKIVTRFIVVAVEQHDVILAGSDRRVIKIRTAGVKHPGTSAA